MPTPEISIIVPVYNAEKYLKRCVDSILSQTFDNFELILIDDGSADSSGEICDAYALQDDRVSVIHQQNSGASAARNAGIDAAAGRYIGFVDVDDSVEPCMYGELLALSKEKSADIVMCDAVTKRNGECDEPDTITQLQKDTSLKKGDISPKLLCELAGSACRCIYNRELLIKNNILFPTGVPLSEDRIFNIQAMGFASGIYYTKTAFYNRYIIPGSAVHRYYPNMCSIAEKVRSGYMEAIRLSWGDVPEYKLAYEKQTVLMAHAAINNAFYKTSPKKFRGKLCEIKEICNCRTILNAIKLTGANDLRSRLIMQKRVLALCLVAIAVNLKRGR